MQKSSTSPNDRKEIFIGYHHVLLTVSSFLIFSATYYLLIQMEYLAIPLERVPAVVGRVMTILHAFVIVPACALYFFEYIDLKTFKNLLSLSIGYFLYDTIAILYYNDGVAEMVTTLGHHLIVIVLSIRYLIKDPKLIAQGLLSEVTAPFLYTCWILMQADMRDLIAFNIFGFIGLVSFLIARIYNFTHMSHTVYKRRELVDLAVFLPILSMNYYYFYVIVLAALS